MRLIRHLVYRLRQVSRGAYLVGLAGTAVVLLALGASGVFTWDYINSSYFCGTTCHLMDPQYQTTLASSHNKVSCVECHVGRTTIAISLTRKDEGVRETIAYVTNNYELPLIAKETRASSESCEKCHALRTLPATRLKEIRHYDDLAPNKVSSTMMAMRIGIGGATPSDPPGVHWHATHEVWYATDDPVKQKIPWVQAIDADGRATTYTEGGKPVSAFELGMYKKVRMDCLDCHNRLAHDFREPTALMDQALAQGRINPNIPFIRKKGVEFLKGGYTSQDEADRALALVELYYRKQFGDYYDKNRAVIQTALSAIRQEYVKAVFPEFSTDWTAHPSNMGHLESPGCFRCHDGNHTTPDKAQSIPLKCSLCHTVPQVGAPGRPTTISTGPVAGAPASHRDGKWLSMHGKTTDATCQQCHDTRNAGGKDNSSFCANGACHGVAWQFAGLDATAQLDTANATAGPAAARRVARPVSHGVESVPDCQLCHGPKTSVKPFPADHLSYANDRCVTCHRTGR
ncbi:MAG: NapC/NirT family cytochrome c [Chloroflexi bacterium]|nr:NapC/NirT family cytochrome c [Chloroflexota bacterium]